MNKEHLKPNLVAIVGPTAVGKTAAAIALAQSINGEIISCDSMQIYRGMDIGTAKASREEQLKVPHHLIDLINPDELFSVADYQILAQEAIEEINNRGRIPILTGGTGLYYQAVVDRYNFFPMESQMKVRQHLEQVCQEKGLHDLFDRLKAIDEDYADKVGPADKKRIIRGLEVFELTGRPFSQCQMKQTDTYHLLVMGLYLDRERLYQRINDRVDQMIQAGLLEEVKGLQEKGYDLSLNAMNALGYKQAWAYLEGLQTFDEMSQEIKRESRRYAKRQYTWFNKDQRIQWLNVAEYARAGDLHKKLVQMVEGQL